MNFTLSLFDLILVVAGVSAATMIATIAVVRYYDEGKRQEKGERNAQRRKTDLRTNFFNRINKFIERENLLEPKGLQVELNEDHTHSLSVYLPMGDSFETVLSVIQVSSYHVKVPEYSEMEFDMRIEGHFTEVSSFIKRHLTKWNPSF